MSTCVTVSLLQSVVLPKVDQMYGQEYKTHIHNAGIKPQNLEEFDYCGFFATQAFVTLPGHRSRRAQFPSNGIHHPTQRHNDLGGAALSGLQQQGR
jgi:hypothetical protein